MYGGGASSRLLKEENNKETTKESATPIPLARASHAHKESSETSSEGTRDPHVLRDSIMRNNEEFDFSANIYGVLLGNNGTLLTQPIKTTHTNSLGGIFQPKNLIPTTTQLFSNHYLVHPHHQTLINFSNLVTPFKQLNTPTPTTHLTTPLNQPSTETIPHQHHNPMAHIFN